MRKFVVIVLLLQGYIGFAQNIARVVEYMPAPGQHINIEKIGTPQAAENMAESESSLVSLGAFGGYVVLRFDEACENASDNPYGVDFTIFGNAFNGSSEPGVVWVMKDENRNGKPDDVWYEIAGSHHFYSKTVKNYGITYFKKTSRNIGWKDSFGNTGMIKANSYNTQEYYPTNQYFTDYPTDSAFFRGTKLYANINADDPMQLSMSTLDFGYADNHPKRQDIDLSIPDNPYTSEVEGAGGDPIDISWAVDSEGNYANLDKIHYVKIVTGYLADLGRLGEASTDVSYIVDVVANPESSGENDLLAFYHPPAKLLLGDSVLLEANYFLKGRKSFTELQFSSSDTEIAEISPEGKLIAKNVGSVKLTVSGGGKINDTIANVVVPDSVAIQNDFATVYPGDTILLEAQVFDNNGDFLDLKTQFSLSNSNIGHLSDIEGKFYFVAENVGEAILTCKNERFGIQETTPIKVLSENTRLKIFFTLKTKSENLFPLQWIEVGFNNLNEHIDNRQNDYTGNNRLNLAHALLAGLQRADVKFTFRDDENSGGKLYLYSIENNGLFFYGWGGKTDPAAFARAWIVRANGKHYLNNFEEIEISFGDTISLYHISDLNNPWQFSRLTASEDSASAGQAVKIFAEETTCVFVKDSISESLFVPLRNQEIMTDKSYFTNENGRVELTLNSNPPWVFQSGNDAVLIHQRVTTSSSSKETLTFKIYPNPAKNYLHFEGQNISEARISISNLNGEELLHNTTSSQRFSFNLEGLPGGLYLVRIEHETEVITTKFIKQ